MLKYNAVVYLNVVATPLTSKMYAKREFRHNNTFNLKYHYQIFVLRCQIMIELC